MIVDTVDRFRTAYQYNNKASPAGVTRLLGQVGEVCWLMLMYLLWLWMLVCKLIMAAGTDSFGPKAS